MITGQIGLVPTAGSGKSAIVGWASKSRWTHVIIAVSETHCVSAESPWAVVRPIADYPEVVWSKFAMRRSQRKIIVDFAFDCVGKSYSWVNYFAAGVALVFRIDTPRWIRSYIMRTDRLICSQLADLALQEAGIHVFYDNRPIGAVVPASFAKVFVERGWTDIP